MGDVLGLKTNSPAKVVTPHELVALAAHAKQPSAACALNANSCPSNAIDEQQPTLNNIGRKLAKGQTASNQGFCAITADDTVAKNRSPDFDPV